MVFSVLSVTLTGLYSHTSLLLNLYNTNLLFFNNTSPGKNENWEVTGFCFSLQNGSNGSAPVKKRIRTMSQAQRHAQVTTFKTFSSSLMFSQNKLERLSLLGIFT
jgi:hypothetical protein